MVEELKEFFKELEMYEDDENNNYKSDLERAILEFLEDETEPNARNIYETFFRAYWIGIDEESNPFIGLMEGMKEYEKNVGRLISKQRDHYLHSAYVFLMGIVIYYNCQNFRETFSNYALDKEIYPDSYDTRHEEFFYRWGIASLFHDASYPLELIFKALNEYLGFISNYTDEKTLPQFLDLGGFEDYFELKKYKILPEYKKEFLKKYPNYKREFDTNPIKLLSNSISKSLSLKSDVAFEEIRTLIKDMEENLFLDHSIFSSVIVLKWFSNLINDDSWNPAYLYYPILDSASAILLHNFFKRLKKKMNLDPLRASQHPIAFLLILCDELQEWGRENYGTNNRDRSIYSDCDLYVDDLSLTVVYKRHNKDLPNELASKKKDIESILATDEIFESFSIREE